MKKPRRARVTKSSSRTLTLTPPSSSLHCVNLLKYYIIVSFFCILIIWSLSLTVKFLLSFLFLNFIFITFHITNRVSFTCRFEKIWPHTPSNIILLALATSSTEKGSRHQILMVLQHVSDVLNQSIIIQYSLHTRKLEVPSKEYSSLCPFKAIFTALKKSRYTNIQIPTFEKQLKISFSNVNPPSIPCRN